MKKNKLENNKFTILYFTANWCGPCKMFKYILEKFLEKNSNRIIFNKIDVDENRGLAYEHNVTTVPTLLFFKNNILVERRSGLLSLDALEKIISK